MSRCDDYCRAQENKRTRNSIYTASLHTGKGGFGRLRALFLLQQNVYMLFTRPSCPNEVARRVSHFALSSLVLSRPFRPGGVSKSRKWQEATRPSFTQTSSSCFESFPTITAVLTSHSGHNGLSLTNLHPGHGRQRRPRVTARNRVRDAPQVRPTACRAPRAHRP